MIINRNVTVKDIQVQNVRTDSNPNNQNRVRKAWVLTLPSEAKDILMMKIKSPEARWALYESLDTEVSDKWIELMRKHYNDSIEAGAKVVLDKKDCQERLEDDFCIDTDELLLDAAEFVMEEFVATLTA